MGRLADPLSPLLQNDHNDPERSADIVGRDAPQLMRQDLRLQAPAARLRPCFVR